MRGFLSIAPTLASCLVIACGAPRGATTSETQLVDLGPPTVPLPAGFREAHLALDGSGNFPLVQWAIRNRLGAVASCFEEARRLDPALRGDLALAFTLTPEGDVAEVKAISGTLTDAPATGCALGALRGVHFEPGPRGVAYTLQIEPHEGVRPLATEELARTSPGDLDVVPLELGTPPALDVTALGADLRRCLAGAEPEQVWVTARIAQGQAEVDGRPVGPATGVVTGNARYCVASKLRRLSSVGGPGFVVSFAGEAGAPEEKPKDKAEFGMIGLLGGTAPGDDEPAAPWARSDGETEARGNLWGDAIGEAYGAGGLGLSGIGEGGGGRGEGIGVGRIGTIGHGTGTGTGQGFGNGHGRLGGAHRTKPPSVRMGKVGVSGRLPPEIIQRIVRQNFGRFRICYETVLRKDPKAAGTVTTTFTIDRDGSVKPDVKSTSNFKDTSINGCVRKAFVGLSFPQPEGGVVKVTYPIAFSSGEEPLADTSKPAAPAPPPAPAPPAAPPPRLKIAGATFDVLEPTALARALNGVHIETRTFPKVSGLLVLARGPDGDVAVIRRVPAAAKGDCAVVDGDVAIDITTSRDRCGDYLGALDVGE